MWHILKHRCTDPDPSSPFCSPWSTWPPAPAAGLCIARLTLCGIQLQCLGFNEKKKYSLPQPYYFLFSYLHKPSPVFHVLDVGLINMLWNFVSGKGQQVCCAPLYRSCVMDGLAISISIMAQMDLKDLYFFHFHILGTQLWQFIIIPFCSWMEPCPGVSPSPPSESSSDFDTQASWSMLLCLRAHDDLDTHKSWSFLKGGLF